jgi:threonylcarbamoyladenosine tRNA methylthiotransferase MtaB
MSRGSRKDIETMEEVDLVLDPAEKGNLIEFLSLGLSTDPGAGWVDWPEDAAVQLGERDRGFLKVQDGCDAACTYCIVPSVRGRSRSLEPERVLKAVRKLMEQGYGEVVLSGIHLGQFGKDLPGNWNLETLLDGYLELDLPGRLRLSSLEPLEITDRLVSIVADAGDRICRHFHIPLQSGSDQILVAMNRPYRREQFVEAVEKIRAAIPGVGIGCDVICGFPGETEEDFAATVELVKKLELPFIHAFPYSPRPGTPAASLKDDVPHHVKKERVAVLTAIVEENRIAFAQGFVGATMVMALESRTDDGGRIVALADNYLRGVVETAGKARPDTMVDLTVSQVDGDLLIASL